MIPNNLKIEKKENGKVQGENGSATLFFTPSKIRAGEPYKIRILDKAVVSYDWWVDKKPRRVRTMDDIPGDIGKGGMNGWSEVLNFFVYSHTHHSVQILSIKQATIRIAMQMLEDEEDWGSLANYNISITKKGSGKESEYSVIPSPKTDLTPQVLESIGRTKVDWDKLFEGKSPFVFKKKETDESVDPDDLPF